MSRERLQITGIVQGVGFRPFVHRLAAELELRGHVGNDATMVFAEVEGGADRVEDFNRRVWLEAPSLAMIERVERAKIDTRGDLSEGFTIIESQQQDGPRTLIAPDAAVCADCVAELFDPGDRRHHHPFITCTNCGPRFTIIERLPYDRSNTTMADFEMCAPCRAEYEDPGDRRYHAQPIGCHDCGPRLELRTVDGQLTASSDEAIARTVDALRAGQTVAIKGLGGYHLACDATNDAAVLTLRARKHRADKPFAVLVGDLSQARRLAEIEASEAALLDSPQAPIVLLRRRESGVVSNAVAPENPLLGLMLAHTPVHHLLFRAGAPPLVMTSANPSGQPLAHRAADLDASPHLFDVVLDNDRRIEVGCDDSVVRVVGAQLLPIRRARGYAPIPVRLQHRSRPILAVGGDHKNTFCVAADGHAWISQHLGAMENLETIRTFVRTVDHFCDAYGVRPELVAADVHPTYGSSGWAREQHGERLVEVQHHHAHIAAVMAEHGLDPVTDILGFAFDGTGYGADGSVWGGEVLRVNASRAERLGHLSPFLLPGGDAGVKHPGRAALAHLHAAGIAWNDDLPPMKSMSSAETRLLRRQLERGFGCVPCSSMGRLFDGVAALLGLRQTISYEAQAAIELEALAESRSSDRTRSYEFDVGRGGMIGCRPILGSIVADLLAGEDRATIAWSVHVAVAELVRRLAETNRHRFETTAVALSGGVFQNALLVANCVERLEAIGLRPLTHSIVPPNDGGLALGQAYVAAHRQEV